ncbi:hypothetical protein ACS0TY_011523 [Phlomoides rotata]
MLEIKGVVDELSLLGVASNPEDLVLKVLNSLDDSYKELGNAIQARDTSITIEAQLAACASTSSVSPVTAFPAIFSVRKLPPSGRQS